MRNLYPKNGRVILHVDMNSFFASVEMANHPELKGKPLAIAGDAKNRRGIVVTSNYEARKYGIKTTMTVWEAKRLCEHLIIRQPNMESYRDMSHKIFTELRNWSDLVEQVSIDEAYIDITECYQMGSPLDIAKEMQDHILNRFDLPCSIGIAPNKYLAKLASDFKKPLGITVLRKRDLPNRLWPLEVIELHGIGKKSASKLNHAKIFTIKEFVDAPETTIQAVLGVRGLKLREYAIGNDKRPVDPLAADVFKSVGSSTTLPQDITNSKLLYKTIEKLSEKVANRLKKKGYMAQTVSITIRYKNRTEKSKSKTVINPVMKTEDISKISIGLFEQLWSQDPVRLLGVTTQNLLEIHHIHEQLDLFTYEKEAQKEPLYKAIDQMKNKYGDHIVQKGGQLFKKDRS